MSRFIAVLAITSLALAACEKDTEVGASDREDVARVVAAYVAPNEIVFDPAVLLVGDEAADAAGEDVDFYVRDGVGERETLPVAEDVAVTVVDCSAACEEGAPSDYDAFTLRDMRASLHRLTVRDGVVVAIDEVYLP